MAVLLLRLSAPLQAWGTENSKFEIRKTGREPSKSGIVGLLAAALGIRRNEPEKLRELNALRIGVRIDRAGKLLRDFHMAHAEKTSYLTERYYLSDAVFLVGLEGERELLERIEFALSHPVFPLFLGRRSCMTVLLNTLEAKISVIQSLKLISPFQITTIIAYLSPLWQEKILQISRRSQKKL